MLLNGEIITPVDGRLMCLYEMNYAYVTVWKRDEFLNTGIIDLARKSILTKCEIMHF